MRSLGALALVIAAAIVGASAPAAAKNAAADAKVAYEQGTGHFKAKRYEAALAAFEAAYKLDPSPILLYNIARCHEEMGDVDKAKLNFNAYLKRVPNSPDRADVERRIRVMEAVAARSRRDSEGTVTPGGVKGTVEPASSGPSALTLSLLGAGAAGVVTGLVFGLRAQDLDDKYTAELSDPRRKRDLGDDAESAATVANISFGVGGALLASGLVFWFLDGEEPTITPTATPGGVGLFGRF